MTRNANETGNGANAGQGTPDAAKRARPVFVDESDADEMPNFEPSPRLYVCACAFLHDAARAAFQSGDNDFLSRAGIADALQFIVDGNAGTGAAAYGEILADWRDARARKIATLAGAKNGGEIARVVMRAQFWAAFDETRQADADTLRERAIYLTGAHTGKLIRTIQSMRNAPDADRASIDRLTDAIIYGGAEKKTPNPARVRAEWMNGIFNMAGESLAQWVGVAALPDYAETLAEIKKGIADNFGIFPAPFGGGDYVKLVNTEIDKLRYIARATQAKQGQAANRPNLSGNVIINSPVPVQVNAPAPIEKPAGHRGGISQPDFAKLLKNFGGKKHGKPYTKRTVQDWEHNRTTPPTAGGVKYTQELRLDILRARKWALDFNLEHERAYNARKAHI